MACENSKASNSIHCSYVSFFVVFAKTSGLFLNKVCYDYVIIYYYVMLCYSLYLKRDRYVMLYVNILMIIIYLTLVH